MELTEEKLRKFVREEAKKVLNEGSYNGPGRRIYQNVMDALQQAEEGGMMGGLGNDHQAYLDLMNAIQREIENRKQSLKKHSNRL